MAPPQEELMYIGTMSPIIESKGMGTENWATMGQLIHKCLAPAAEYGAFESTEARATKPPDAQCTAVLHHPVGASALFKLYLLEIYFSTATVACTFSAEIEKQRVRKTNVFCRQLLLLVTSGVGGEVVGALVVVEVVVGFGK